MGGASSSFFQVWPVRARWARPAFQRLRTCLLGARPLCAAGSFHEENVVAEKLGWGSYASVYAVRKRGCDAPSYAAKVISLRLVRGKVRRGEEMLVERELRILQTVADKNCDAVVRFHEAYREGSTFYIVMELCDKTLVDTLEGLDELTEAIYRPMFRDMLRGLSAVHSVGVVHRDVKPDNYMCVRRGGTCIIKLCDFGLAKVVTAANRNELLGVNGTAPFMAPEMLKGLRYSTKVDVWSLGVLVYALLFGHFPYAPRIWTCEEMKWAIQAGVPTPCFNARVKGYPDGAFAGAVSADARALVASLLERAPVSRSSADAALAHAFFGGGAGAATASLKPMLSSAESCGAFARLRHNGEGGAPSALDLQVASLQVRHGHFSHWSRQTTASSNVNDPIAGSEVDPLLLSGVTQ
mmetsp:Transcript_27494/g.79213  ORF Transcript_27494/g.79213 Transcript_27494/m.79213 type:complete len:410 (+) Transcript_27494:103-1332(+)